jgi:hypothetical protein
VKSNPGKPQGLSLPLPQRAALGFLNLALMPPLLGRVPDEVVGLRWTPC